MGWANLPKLLFLFLRKLTVSGYTGYTQGKRLANTPPKKRNRKAFGPELTANWSETQALI
jgi:hypothetical protein